MTPENHFHVISVMIEEVVRNSIDAEDMNDELVEQIVQLERRVQLALGMPLTS